MLWFLPPRGPRIALLAERLYGAAASSAIRGPRGGKNHNIADAILLAHYGSLAEV